MEIKKADNKPTLLELEKGKTYAWCSCGHSANQPWCDGSHKGSEHTPHVFQAKETKTYALCLCKGTQNAAFCDGSHSK
jgi:CDGSH-type Zn-finger protein